MGERDLSRTIGQWRQLALLPAVVALAGAIAAGTAAGGQTPPQVVAQQVGETNGISIIQLTGTYDTELGGQPNVSPRQAVATEFYRTHPDVFDFLVVIPNFAFSSSDGIAFHWGVRSSVQGIGMPPMDIGSSFGSAAQLQGFIDMAPLAQMETDPLQPGFEFTLDTLAHEILHQWGIHIADNANDLIGQDNAHWSYLVDTAASVEYGAKWQDNADGTFTTVAARRFYSPLDLYLAGFYDASEVPPFLVITSPGTDPTQLPTLGATVTGSGRLVSMPEIVSVNGPRVPAAAAAQHAFKAAFLFVTRPGDVVSDDQLAAIDRVRREAMTHFAILTGGRGTLDITSAALPTAAPGSPAPIGGGGPLRSTAASVPDALAWLRAQQSAAGYWQDVAATRPRDSAVVLPTLVAYDPLFSAQAQQLAAGWLGGQSPTNTDGLARMATALGSPALRASLAAQANADGGWGLGPGYGSDPLDTALAALALAGAPGAPPAALTAAGQFLLANQGADGGWGNVAAGASRTGPTALVVEALHALGLTAAGSAAGQAATTRALAFLAARQNADGGFGDSPSTAHDTAAALQAALDTSSGGAIRALDAATYLNTHQAQTGSWEGSTSTTAAVVNALQRFTVPNWTFSGPLVAAPAAPADGDRVTLTLTVLSNGDVAAPAGVVRVYDGNPAAGGTAIGPDLAIPPLLTSQTAALTATWDTYGKAGAHTLYAVIDPDNQVAELSKADNQASLPLTVTAAPAGIDLEVRGGDISISPPQPTTLPVQLAISAIVRDNGQTAAPAVDVRLYQGTPGAGGIALGDVTVALPARGSAVANFVATLATSGTTTYTVVADPDNLIPETDKTNNSASASVTTAATVDLGLAAADIQLAGPAYLGETATFQVTFHNYGTVDAPQANVTYTVTDGTTTRTLTPGTLILAAGSSRQETVTWHVDLTGNLTFTATIQQVAADTNPANNQASLAFTASAIQQAELTVGDGDLTLTPSPGREGQPLTAALVVHNAGAEDVTNLEVGFYAGDPTQGAPLLAPLAVVPTVPAGGAATATVTAPALASAGNLVITGLVDPNDQQTLFSRANLSTFVVLPVLSLPDAAIGSGSLVLSPAFPTPGATVTLDVTVANLGEQSIANLLVAAYDGDPAAGGVAVGTFTLPLLLGNSSAPGSVTWTLAAGGNRSLFVVVDPDNAVVEASKANNTASLPITVQQGNFTVTNRYFSPNGDGVQDTTELDFRLGAPATVTFQVVNTQGQAVRTAGGGAAYTGVTGGSFVWDGKDDLGRVVADGDYVLRVLGSDGSEQGETVATVDTDRSPLFAAIGTPYLTSANLTCPVGIPGALFYSADEQTVFFTETTTDSASAYDIGIYQEAPLGGNVQTVVATSFFAGTAPSQLIASADASELAFEAEPFQSPYSLWTVATGGAGAPSPLSTDDADLLSFDAAGQNVVVASPTAGIEALPLAGGAPRVLYDGSADGADVFGNIPVVAPDRSLAAGIGVDGTDNAFWIADLAAGGGQVLPIDGDVTFVAWSPDSQRLAVSTTDSVEVWSRTGAPLGSFPMPTDLPDFAAATGLSFQLLGVNASWSSDASQVAAQLNYGSPSDCFGFMRMVTVDPASGSVATVAYSQLFQPGCLSFHVSTWDGRAWAERGVLHFDPEQREHRLDLGRLAPRGGGELRVRIRQTGGSAAAVDRVSLLSGTNRQAPVSARRLDDRRDVLAPLLALDGRRLDLHEAEMELVWQHPLPGRLQLSLNATEGLPEDLPAALQRSAAGRATTAAAPGGAAAGRGAARPQPRAQSVPVLPLTYPLLAWAPNQDALVVFDTRDIGQSSQLFDLTTGAETALLPQLPGLQFAGFSPAGRAMLYQYLEPAAAAACADATGHTWALRSLMNLTADLSVRQDPASAAFILEGTAADLHFSRYELDYADAANPTVWTAIVPPSTTPLLAAQFTTWVPPGPGSFLVRLTVADLAGNSRTAVRRVSSSASPEITALSLTPRYISPNGDGVDDTADIHYQVLQPVHLAFRFYDPNGNLVRTIVADNDQVGSSFDLTWDGTDDAGTVVPDGDYTMQVLGYQLPISVVTTPPQITLAVAPALQCSANGPAYAPSLTAKATSSGDAPLATLAIETGVGALPFDWEPAVPGPLTPAQFENHSFRVRATDAAGNSAEQQLPPGPEEIFLTSIATRPVPCPLIPGAGILATVQAPVLLQVAESVIAPITEVFVDAQPLPASGIPDPLAWAPEVISTVFPPGSNVPQTTVPNVSFQLAWDLKNAPLGQNVAVRVRVVDGTGVTHVTAPVNVFSQGFEYYVVATAAGQPAPVAALLAEAKLSPPDDRVLGVTLIGQGGYTGATLEVTSAVDPRFTAPQTLEPSAGDGTNFLFSSPLWQNCTAYSGTFLATAPPQVDPATGLVTSPTLATAPFSFTFSCLKVAAQLENQAPASCGSVPSTQRVFDLTPFSVDGTPLQLLTVSGAGGVLYSISNPSSATLYKYAFDTASMPTGLVAWQVEITDIHGHSLTVPYDFTVEHAPPTAIWSYPQPGQAVCANQNRLVVRGTVADALSVTGAVTATSDLNGAAVAGCSLSPADAQPGDILSAGEIRGALGCLTSVSGPVTAQLQATNAGGYATCVTTSFTVDAQVDTPAVGETPLEFSRAASGVATVTTSAGEPAHANLTVVPAAYPPNVGGAAACIPTATAVRQLANGVAITANSPANSSWDGTDDGGAVVADGVYAIVAAFADDSCGNTATARTCVVVDNTPPVTAIDYPGPSDPLGLEVEVKGSVGDANLATWTLDVGAGSSPATWAAIQTGTGAVSHDVLGSWNTYGLTGIYTLRLRAADLAGNTSMATSTVNLASVTALVTDLEAQPRLFSPNGDGRLETTNLLYSLSTPAAVTLTVQNGAGATVRTLANAATAPQGSSAVAWDGRGDGGARVADGVYTVVLAAAAAANAGFTDRQSITVEVDATPPTVAVTRPAAAGWVTPTSTIQGSITDPNLTSWTLALTATPQAPVWTPLASGTTDVAAAALASLAGLADGQYALKIDAADAAQNQTELIVPFGVIATPPQVTLAAPAAGAVVGAVGGPVPVAGAIVDTHLASWSLQLGAGTHPATWSTLTSGATLPLPSPLPSWTISGLADGPYVLQLVATDLAAQTAAAQAAVTVDNTPPVVAITAPAAGAYVTAPMTVTGTASDANLASYQLAVAATPAGGAGGAAPFSPVGAGTAAVSGGALATWTALPPDGPATLQLTAVDRAGNQATTQVQVVVHTHPPAAPAGLAAQVVQQSVHLSWLANTESDIAGYRLYRNGALVDTQQLITGTTYVDAGLAAATYGYTLRAVDQAGLQSAPSAPAQAVVDPAMPTAVLSRPEGGSRVGGVVSIVGTAEKLNDFAEYRVYVTPLDGSTPRQLLRTSPLPVVADELAEWDTTALADNAAFTLRLEAEDLEGNVAAAEVTVTVDNTPPAAPTGLTATPDGSTVHLTWNANTESDLAGYLLYRNGQLVNAVGAVVGDLTPYLLANPAWDDLGLPDGTFVYVVYAVDTAGNQSAASAPAQATLDNHPPHVEITQPAAGTVFQDSLNVVGTTADLDVASVQFQWQAAGASAWTDLGAAVTSPPWEVVWDASALAYGGYLLRAVGTDNGGKTDPAPDAIAVTRRNLVRPPAPVGLGAAVAGGTVTLTWSSGTPVPGDLAGYLVTRTAADGTASQLTATPIAAATYADAGVADGTWAYTVTAVNQSGNVSDPSAAATAVVYTPVLVQPYTPTAATATALAGSGAAAGAQVAGTDSGSAGSVPIVAVAADAGGNFGFAGLPLARGDNQLTVAATDAAGNVSKSVSVPVLAADPPSPPSGVSAVAAAGGGLGVQLGWNANPAAESVLGYRLLRDGQPVPAPVAVGGPFTASASSDSGDAAAAVDGDETTFWSPQAGSDPDLRNQWLELDGPAASLLARVEIDWAAPIDQPQNAGDFDLQGWDGRVWVPLAAVRGATGAQSAVTFAASYLTARVRLHLVASSAPAPLVAEMRLYQYPLTAGTTASDTTTNGNHAYQVVAVGPLGLESQPSAAASVAVGDTTAPPAVTLAGAAIGADVGLTWTASAADDLASYQVLREGVAIASVAAPATAYTDAARPNGTWHYTVVAVDAAGNASPPSNVVAVTVAVAAPPAPSGLAVAVVASGGALDLTWTAGGAGAGGSGVIGFEVERALVAGGPYQVVGTPAASPWRDSGLVNGTTYYYVVVAVDAAGNISAPSNQAQGTPADTQAPPAPVLTFPAASPLAFQTAEATADLAGTAEPGATVVLPPAALGGSGGSGGGTGAGGTRSTTALAAAATLDSGTDNGAAGVPSPDGRYLLLPQIGTRTVTLYDFEAAGGGASLSLPAAAAGEPMAWMADGRGLYVLASGGGEIDSYRFAGAVRAPVATVDWVAAVAAAPDGERLAAIGSLGGQAGVWVFDPAAAAAAGAGAGATAGWSELAALDPSLAGDAEGLVWSPEGSYLAYVGPQPLAAGGGGVGGGGSGGFGVVVVQVAAPNAALLVEANPGSGRPSFTPDGSAVAFTEAQPGGGEKVRLATVASGAAVDLTDVEAGPLLPQLAPDGSALAYAGANGLVTVPVAPYNPAGPPPVVVASLGGSPAFDVAWVPGGYLVVDDGDDLRIAPAGRFAFAAQPLALGANSFTATAQDAAGNASAASAPRLIQRLAANLPDLAIAPADLVIVPAAPLAGQTARVSATVHNQGPADAPATTLALTAYGPGGAQVQLATALPVPAIAAGGAATVFADGAVSGPVGAWTLAAQVDPAGLVQELRRDNDAAQIAFQLTAQGPPTVAIATDQATYQPNGTVTATVTVWNGSAVWSGQAVVTIEDTAGYVVATLPALPIANLAYAQQWTQTATWNVGATFAGSYLADVKLLDAQGQTAAEATAPFVIVTVANLAAAVTTDRTTYTVGASVHVTAQVSYPSGDAALAGVAVHLQVLGPLPAGGGTPPVAGDWTQTLGTLLPGGQGSVSVDWASGGGAAGSYQAVATVLDGGQAAASAATQFSLTATAGAVTGTLALSDRAPSAGTPLTAAYTIADGGGALPQVPVRVRVLDAASGSEITRQSAALDLPAGGTASGSAQFDTDALGLGSRLAVLEADLPAAGGGGGGATQTTTLALVGFTVYDRTPPAVAISQPAGGATVGGTFDVIVAVRDPLSTVTAVSVSLDGGAGQTASPSDPAAGTYKLHLAGVAAGAHTLAAQAADAAGNTGESASVAVTVGGAPPVITITGIAAGGLYAAAVTPVVTITAATATYTATVTLDGQPFTSGTPVASDGAHTLAVAATDADGNQASATVAFAIDTTPPAIAVTGVVQGGVYNAAVTPVVTVTDAHPGTSTITLNGQSFVTGTPVTAEGTYALAVTAVDAAGNQASAAVGFSIDKTPPAIAITGVAQGGFYNAAVTPVVTVTDAHQGTATITLNGQPFASGTAVTAEGGYTLAVTAVDAAGNQATASLTFTIDKTPPVIQITGVAAGSVYNTTVTPVITVTDAHPGTTTITLNAQPFASGTPVAAEGSYTLAVTATDAAGNQASASVAFTIDKTPPVITITGVTAGSVSKTTVTPVVTVTDAHPGTSTITLNGQPFTSGTAVTADGSYTLAVTATDAAGNQASASVAFAIDKTPPVITITGVSQGGVYNASVTPVITVTDAHLGTSTVTLNGQPFTSGTAIAAEGSYTLAVTATDAAGNQATTSVAFAIDKTAPVITITGVSQGSVYNAAVTPVVTVSDAHPGTTTITLNAQPFTSGTAVTADGSYTLAVTATDAAGNQASASAAFTLDKTAPVIQVTGVGTGGVYNTSVTPVVTVTDAHPGTTTITLNGQPFTSGTAVSAEGSYTLAVTATDTAGNQASLSVSFAIDETPPAISVTGVTAGGAYSAAVTPVVTVTDAHLATVTTTLNGQPFASGTAVSATGSYQLLVTAVDAAGNQAQMSVSFTIAAATPPALGLTKSAALAVDADGNGVVSPGDTLRYTLTLTNGGGAASGVVVGDAIPANTTVVAGSVTTSQGTVDSENPVQVAVGTLAGGAAPVTVTFQVVIARPLPAGVSAISNQATATAAGQATVVSDDPSTPQVGDPTMTPVVAGLSLSVADVTLVSPLAGSVPALFPVSLSAPAAGSVSVQYSAVPGSAGAWIDFLPVAGTLTFPAGSVLADVAVPVLADPLLTGPVTFSLELSQPQGAALARATAVGTIQAGPTCITPNLLINPGAELPTVSSLLPGWDLVAGTAWQVATGPTPLAAFAGDDDFATSDAAGEIKQDVDLSAWAQQIAAPAGQAFAFAGALATANAGGGAAASTARIVVEYRDAANQAVLSSYDSGWVASPLAWQQLADQRTAPAGTGWVRVRLLSQLPAGGGGTALFDGLALTAVETPALAALDVAAPSPAAGQQQPLTVQVVLSCAALQTVTVAYATVDDTAVAGTDYVAASGTLTFAPGTVEKNVPLTALGIAGDTVDRLFDLVLTQPAGAVLGKPVAQVRLLPRPFCAQPPAYWRHHLESWTAPTLTLGGATYGQGAALGLLGYTGGDPLWLLAQQLAATRLDLGAGAAASGQTAAANADAFLVQHALGTTLQGSDPQTAANLTAALVAYDSATCPLVCSAEPLGAAGRFNLFVLGNLSQSGTDTAGRLAAAGNATLASYSVGQSLTATGGTDDVLIAGGALSFNGGTVSHGNVVHGGAVTLTSVSVPNGTVRQDQPVDFAAAGRELTLLSTYWGGLAANGTTTVQPWKAIQLAGTDPTLDIFSVRGNDLASASSFTIQVPAGATALVNIDGTGDKMQNFGFQLTGLTGNQVILNFYQATTLQLSGIGVPGTVLAPRAAVTFSNGNVNGTLVGASLTGGGQLNQALFTGCLPVGH